MIDHVLRYVDRGWACFPLHDVVAGVCSCGGQPHCTPGKHPRTRTGLSAATRNPDVLRNWWREHPQANIGVRTGRESGLVVLDLDLHKPGAAEGLQGWLARNGGGWGKPLTVQTGSGGLHLYYAYPDVLLTVTIPTRKGLDGVAGLDVRADGGYVVAPPSRILKGSYAFV